MIVDLPQPVERYFAQKMRYHHNVVTMATDGPANIVPFKKQASFAVNPYRLYVENLLSSTPTKFKPADPKVRLSKCLRVEKHNGFLSTARP